VGNRERPSQEPPARGAGPQAGSICIVDGFYEGLELPIDRDWLVLGRGKGADVMIVEPTISRAHAAFGHDHEGFFVQDLDSTNGTFVNGVRCKRTILSDGDGIQMGKLRLRVRLPA
jgi:pSer/pThr/pTyr-binding forkhead associated (FHA) protein